MQQNYSKKTDPIQKASKNTASSVLDASSQSEALQRKADMANNAAQREEAPRPNNTGMPDNLKSGIESLSGFSMDDVRVHYNSSKPATVQALAYTQGTDIHVAPGQEKHLPHEAWHVAQQMAGRVSPTTNINGMPVNDNAGLEHEADVMGEKAVQCKELAFKNVIPKVLQSIGSTIQCGKGHNRHRMHKKKHQTTSSSGDLSSLGKPAAAGANPPSSQDSQTTPSDRDHSSLGEPVAAATAGANSPSSQDSQTTSSDRDHSSLGEPVAAAVVPSSCSVYDLAESSDYYDPERQSPTFIILNKKSFFYENDDFFNAFKQKELPSFDVEPTSENFINTETVIRSLYEIYLSKKRDEMFTTASQKAYQIICSYYEINKDKRCPLAPREETPELVKELGQGHLPTEKEIALKYAIFRNNWHPVDLSFTDETDLTNQLVQDYLLSVLFDRKFANLIGREHHTFSDFSFSSTTLTKSSTRSVRDSDKPPIPLSTLKERPTGKFILYRILRIGEIARQQQTNSKSSTTEEVEISIFPTGGKGGHGGALGTALHYFGQSQSEDCLLVKVIFDEMPDSIWNTFMIKFDYEGDDAKSETTSELPLDSPKGGREYAQFSFSFSPSKKLRNCYITAKQTGKARCEVIQPLLQLRTFYRYRIFDYRGPGGTEIWKSP